VSCPLF